MITLETNKSMALTASYPPGFGALLKGKYIYEVQLFAGSSVVKIPT